MAAPSMVCATCHRPLDAFTGVGPPRYEHTAKFAHYKHRPVPVARRANNALNSCDFCPGLSAVWVVRCRDFPYPSLDAMMPMQISVGDWAACEECGQLVHDGKWDELATHAGNAYALDLGLDPVRFRPYLRELHSRLRKNMTGISR